MNLENIWHVVPLNDLFKHDTITFNNGENIVCECDCEPSISTEENGFVVIHHSFDGREGIEAVNEILNK
jgi:hypothetical protein